MMPVESRKDCEAGSGSTCQYISRGSRRTKMKIELDFDISNGEVTGCGCGGELLDVLKKLESWDKALACCHVVAEAALEFSDKAFPEDVDADRSENVMVRETFRCTVYRSRSFSLDGETTASIRTTIASNDKDIVHIETDGEKGKAEFLNMEVLDQFLRFSDDILAALENNRIRDVHVLKESCEQYRKKKKKEKGKGK